MPEDNWLSIAYGNAGWVRVDSSDVPGVVYARFSEDSTGRLAVRELYVDGRGEAIKSADLRELDLTRLGTLVGDEWSIKGRPRLGAPGPDLARLASHFATSPAPRSSHWVSESMRAQLDRSRQAPMGRDPKRPAEVGRVAELAGPPEAGLTDDFLRDVAAAYATAVRRGRHPAPELAAQAGVSPRTVHAWVVKARDRGIMPKAGRTPSNRGAR